MKYRTTTNQPRFACVANLGDTDPINYGGKFVYIDTTGVYDPELEILEEPLFNGSTDKPETEWVVYRICLESHTYTTENRKGERIACDPENPDGVLSDNSYHLDYPVWYADKIESIASTVGCDASDLITRFCSDNPVTRASAYVDVTLHYGPSEFDQYPLYLGKNASRVAFRYRTELKRLKRFNTWRVGYLNACHSIMDAKGGLLVNHYFTCKHNAREYAKDHGIALVEKTGVNQNV